MLLHRGQQMHAGNALCLLGSWQHFSVRNEVMKPPSRNYNVKSKVRLHQLICMYLMNNPDRFHPILI